jgi:hypothetical protein
MVHEDEDGVHHNEHGLEFIHNLGHIRGDHAMAGPSRDKDLVDCSIRGCPISLRAMAITNKNHVERMICQNVASG